MFRSIIVRQLRGAATTGAWASLVLAALDGLTLALVTSTGWRISAAVSLGVFVVLAIAMFVGARRVERRPEVVELFEHTGSIAGIVMGDKLIRVLLQSGSEVRLPVRPSERSKIVGLLRGHSPNARVTDA